MSTRSTGASSVAVSVLLPLILAMSLGCLLSSSSPMSNQQFVPRANTMAQQQQQASVHSQAPAMTSNFGGQMMSNPSSVRFAPLPSVQQSYVAQPTTFLPPGDYDNTRFARGARPVNSQPPSPAPLGSGGLQSRVESGGKLDRGEPMRAREYVGTNYRQVSSAAKDMVASALSSHDDKFRHIIGEVVNQQQPLNGQPEMSKNGINIHNRHATIKVGNNKEVNVNNLRNTVAPVNSGTQSGQTIVDNLNGKPKATPEQKQLKKILLDLAEKAISTPDNLLRFNSETQTLEPVQQDPNANLEKKKLLEAIKSMSPKKLDPDRLKRVLAEDDDNSEVASDASSVVEQNEQSENHNSDFFDRDSTSFAPYNGNEDRFGHYSPDHPEEDYEHTNEHNYVPGEFYEHNLHMGTDQNDHSTGPQSEDHILSTSSRRIPHSPREEVEYVEPAEFQQLRTYIGPDDNYSDTADSSNDEHLDAPNDLLREMQDLLADRMNRISDLLYFRPEVLTQLSMIDDRQLAPVLAEFKRMVLCNADEQFCNQEPTENPAGGVYEFAPTDYDHNHNYHHESEPMHVDHEPIIHDATYIDTDSQFDGHFYDSQEPRNPSAPREADELRPNEYPNEYFAGHSDGDHYPPVPTRHYDKPSGGNYRSRKSKAVYSFEHAQKSSNFSPGRVQNGPNRHYSVSHSIEMRDGVPVKRYNPFELGSYDEQEHYPLGPNSLNAKISNSRLAPNFREASNNYQKPLREETARQHDAYEKANRGQEPSVRQNAMRVQNPGINVNKGLVQPPATVNRGTAQVQPAVLGSTANPLTNQQQQQQQKRQAQNERVATRNVRLPPRSPKDVWSKTAQHL